MTDRRHRQQIYDRYTDMPLVFLLDQTGGKSITYLKERERERERERGETDRQRETHTHTDNRERERERERER